MGRPRRQTPGGYVYHVLNRANGRLPIFTTDGDCAAFELILLEGCSRVPGIRLLSYCLMPNHWHMILWPTGDSDLSTFLHWVTLTHTQRWKTYHQQVGTGHLYQGRFKSFPIQEDSHFLTVCRYVERNALRAGLVDQAEEWHWNSLWHRRKGTTRIARILTEWPVPMPVDWEEWVNTPLTFAELESVREARTKGMPFGEDSWKSSAATLMGLESTLKNRGRPKKSKN